MCDAIPMALIIGRASTFQQIQRTLYTAMKNRRLHLQIITISDPRR